MLKKRIIPIQLLKDGRLVKGQQFANYRAVGDPVSSSGVYNSQIADELIFLNTNSELGIAPLLTIIEKVSEVAFMPMSVGGGIHSIEDASQLISQGADKVIVNSGCYDNYALLQDIATKFGIQAVVVCIDVRREKGSWHLYSRNGKQRQTISLEAHINNCLTHGTGELMLQSIDLDGSMQGYDIELAQYACKLANVPIIIAGGSGNYQQLKQAFCKTDISAVACGSLFNFSDSNPIRAKAFLQNHDIPFKKVK